MIYLKRGEKMKRSSMFKEKEGIYKKEDRSFALLLLPFMVTFFFFSILPILSSMGLSLFDYDMVSRPIFIGADNYVRMFTSDAVFLRTLGNTFKFALVAGPLGYILAFLLAWMINDFGPVLRIILTFIFFVPSLSTNALYIWQIMFSSDSYGYINSFLISFGLINEPIQWFQNTDYNMLLIILVQLWMSMGICFLANIAGLQNVNSELYEAGAIDGIRTRWHELWYITLPSMKNILLFSAVMQIQSVFSVSTLITTLVGYPSVDNSVDTIVSYITDIGTTRYEMGYACALSVLLFMIILFIRYLVGGVLKLVGKSE